MRRSVLPKILYNKNDDHFEYHFSWMYLLTSKVTITPTPAARMCEKYNFGNGLRFASKAPKREVFFSE